MAASLPDLEQDLKRALEADDLERINAIRRTIAEGHPDTEAGAEASYKLGLAALFAEGNLDQAAERFRTAAKMKSPRWASAARTSLGIVLHRQGKSQQAVFELRKVASQKPPSMVGAQALGLVALVLRESNNGAEAERARAEQLKMLGGLTQSADAEDAALAHYLIGLELKFEGRRAEAKKHLEAALAKNGLPADEQDRLRAALKDL